MLIDLPIEQAAVRSVLLQRKMGTSTVALLQLFCYLPAGCRTMEEHGNNSLHSR